MTSLSEVPRIYTSFADFEREEWQRLGLVAWPAPALESANHPAATVLDAAATAPLLLSAPRTTVRPVLRPITRVTPASLRAEGIVEMGCTPGTSVLFVRTRVKLHLVHATWLPDRQLDDYAVRLAVNWIEGFGMPSYEVAKNLDVGETTLRKALSAAGYERLGPERHEQLAQARAARKPGKRGRLVRVNNAAGAQEPS